MQNKRLANSAKSYLSGIFLYGLGILLFRHFPYYKNTLNPSTQQALLYLYIGYAVFTPAYYFFFQAGSAQGRPYLFLKGVKNLINYAASGNPKYAIGKDEKTAILFMLVKLFFLPTMVDFFFGNLGSFAYNLKNFEWYSFALISIFTVDTLIFAFGYAFESNMLKNTVKSVEPTVFGWLVALICYPPFNSQIGKFVPWGANDYAYFWSSSLTVSLRILLVFLLIIYVWASVALGFKASNLTNRGIVAKFPYSLIRHPAYSSKVMAWWITLLPVMSLKFALGMAFWTIIYFFRATTEEKHLSKDKDYVEYCRKVKYKFVPLVI